MEDLEKKPKKIIVCGVVSPEITLRINELAEKHGAIIEYTDIEEGKEAYAIAEGFDPNPPKVTIPYTPAPYLSFVDEIMPYKDLNFYLNDGQPHSKYARSATQAELDAPKVGRNEPCHCGSGKKSKKCCNK